MAPIAAGEQAQLAAVDHAFDALLDAAEIGRAGFFVIRNGLRDRRSLGRIGLERRGHIHPIERVQMIEVDHVVLHHLRAGDQIADDARVVGHLDVERVFDRADARQRVDHGAHSADALRPDPGFARIAALQDHLDAAEHGSGAPGVGDLSAIHLGFNAQVAFNAVTGSTTRRAMLCLLSFFGSDGAAARRFRRGFDHLDQAVRRDAGDHGADQSQADLAGGNLDAEAGHRRAAGRRTATCDPRSAARRRRCSRVRRGSANWCDRSTAPPDS